MYDDIGKNWTLKSNLLRRFELTMCFVVESIRIPEDSTQNGFKTHFIQFNFRVESTRILIELATKKIIGSVWNYAWKKSLIKLIFSGMYEIVRKI